MEDKLYFLQYCEIVVKIPLEFGGVYKRLTCNMMH